MPGDSSKHPHWCLCAADSYIKHAGFIWDFAAALPIIPQVGWKQHFQPVWKQQWIVTMLWPALCPHSCWQLQPGCNPAQAHPRPQAGTGNVSLKARSISAADHMAGHPRLSEVSAPPHHPASASGEDVSGHPVRQGTPDKCISKLLLPSKSKGCRLRAAGYLTWSTKVCRRLTLHGKVLWWLQLRGPERGLYST